MTTGRINQVTIVAPRAFRQLRRPRGRPRAPRGEIVGRPGAPADRGPIPQAAQPGRGQGAPRGAILLPPLSSQSDVSRRARPGGRAPPRRSPRRPQPRGAALQRSLQVRGLLLLLQMSGRCQAPTEAHRVADWWPKPPAPGGIPPGQSLKSAAPSGDDCRSAPALTEISDLYVGGCIAGHDDSRLRYGTWYVLCGRPRGGGRLPREGARQAAQPVLGAAQRPAPWRPGGRAPCAARLAFSLRVAFFFLPSCSPCALVAR